MSLVSGLHTGQMLSMALEVAAIEGRLWGPLTGGPLVSDRVVVGRRSIVAAADALVDFAQVLPRPAQIAPVHVDVRLLPGERFPLLECAAVGVDGVLPSPS